ncbi:MAG: GNAT family N-acetyltransferase, partial [Pseudonocardia sp.]|nr:GNAT family N-acetyltransferase [Pseudonocardia sp.]
MDHAAVLAVYDEQVRRRPTSEPGGWVEWDDDVIRTVGPWSGIGWSDLHPDRADAVIAAQVARFGELERSWEWKHYSHDPVTDLPDRLLVAGFTPEPAETLLVAEITGLRLDAALPEGVVLVPVVDEAGVDALVAVHDEVFGGDHSAIGRAVLAGLGNATAAA